MESWFCSCWIHLGMVLVLFKNISGDPTATPHYTVHLTNTTFEQAMQACSPGVLTTLATDQEVANILGLISNSALPHNQNDFSLWVGLRKVKNECVVHTQPLKGFKWVEDGSEETQVSRWMEEPERTCTTVRCAALKVELDGSRVTRWGLIPVKCKLEKPFICKLRGSLTGGKPKPHKPATPGPEPEPEPGTAATKPPDVEPPTPDPKTVTQKPEPTTSGPGLTTPGSKPEADLKPQVESDPQEPDPDRASGPVLSSDSCQNPVITNSRFITLDPDNSSRIQVECWSKGPSVQLELHCSGRPAVWRLLDGSPANFTAICQPCESGFQKDATGNCVDIDECSAGDAPCRHTCLNTEGSFRCVCSDEDGKQQDENSPVCVETPTGDNSPRSTTVLFPVLVATAALLVLVLVVAVTVRCCLMRRSKKRAKKKAEKMAMKSKESSQAH